MIRLVAVLIREVLFRNTTGANNTCRLDLGAVYIQDQIEITKYIQLIGGARFDRFDLELQDPANGCDSGPHRQSGVASRRHRSQAGR